MKLSLFILGLTLATVYSTVIQTKPERKLADADFLTKQKQVLDLYLGLGHTENFHNEFMEFDFNANAANFVKPEVVKEFLEAYHKGFLPLDGIFTFYCHHTMTDTIRLFDLFYFAKDFDTFYRAASWARKHINPLQFGYAYTLALLHREDCQHFALPPLYEILPNYFVPADTLHEVYDAKMLGVKTRRFTYNNTGYEYNYHDSMFGGPFSRDAVGHLDYKISYFREDVGLNSWYPIRMSKFPTWMEPEKYRGSHWYRRGETLYHKYQQLFARYTLERLANGLPYVERLYWKKPIRVGYNPRVQHFNGEQFYTRPDYLVLDQVNKLSVVKAKTLEKRILDTIDFGAILGANHTGFTSLRDNDGIDHLGRIVFSVADNHHHHHHHNGFHGHYFWRALGAIGFSVHTSNDHKYNGGAVTSPMTTLRDPVFYQFLNRLIGFFQHHKKSLPRYTEEQVHFHGVKVKDFEVDKFVTYFDNFEYEITNAVPFKDVEEYKEYHYYARQYRLNHKPYNYKLSIHSDEAKEGYVRVFIGPKYDSEERELNLEQSRLAFVELDRFPVKLAVGENVVERNSKESPIFVSDPEGFRSLYGRVKNALKNTEQFYYSERYSCGVPSRIQLPRGWKHGQPFRIAVVVTPFEPAFTGDEKTFYAPCGGAKLHDNKPLGFPFDRPLDDSHALHVPNVLFKDVLIYHKDESDVNRNQ